MCIYTHIGRGRDLSNFVDDQLKISLVLVTCSRIWLCSAFPKFFKVKRRFLSRKQPLRLSAILPEPKVAACCVAQVQCSETTRGQYVHAFEVFHFEYLLDRQERGEQT